MCGLTLRKRDVHHGRGVRRASTPQSIWRRCSHGAFGVDRILRVAVHEYCPECETVWHACALLLYLAGIHGGISLLLMIIYFACVRFTSVVGVAACQGPLPLSSCTYGTVYTVKAQ